MSRPKKTKSTPDREAELSIGQVAKETGLSTATINFYVAQEVLPPPRKLNRTRAAYGPKHVRLLKLVRKLQATGLSLHYIKGVLASWGRDEAGLRKLEGIGYLRPLPRPRNDPQKEPIEPFEPVDRATFVSMANVSSEVIAELETRGLLRPKQPGRYDARDLWLVRNAQSLLDDGLSTEQLTFDGHVVAMTQAIAPLVVKLVERHADALRSREMRVTDLYTPIVAMFDYLSDRALDERFPDWRLCFWTGGPHGN